MKTIKTVLSIFWGCLLLAACGGGGSSGPSAMPHAGQVLEIYSDSTGLTAGSNGKAWPDQISLPGRQVSNQSVSGLAAIHLLAGRPQANVAPWALQMRRSPAATVLVGLVINDAVNTDPATFASTLAQIASIARAEGKQVIFQTANPTDLPEVTQYSQLMRQTAAALDAPLIDQDASLQGRAATVDGVHPTPATVDRMAAYAGTRLLEILK